MSHLHDIGTSWEIDFRKITLERKVAAGAAGVVWKGTYEGSAVALKQFFSNMMQPEFVEELRREAALLSQLRHPNVMMYVTCDVCEVDRLSSIVE